MALCYHEGYPNHGFSATTVASPRVCTVHCARCGKPGLRETVEAHCVGHAGMLTQASPGQHMPHGRTDHSCSKASCCRTPDSGCSLCCHELWSSLRGLRSRRRAAHQTSTGTWSPEARAHPPGGPALAQSPLMIPPPITRHDFRRRFRRRGWGLQYFLFLQKQISTSQEFE
jgi:hypothetical protein